VRLRHLLAMLGDWFGRGEGLMAAPRCDLTDLLVTDCAHCRGVKSVDEETKAERARLLATGRWVVAQYADGWNTSGSIEEVQDALATLMRHCDEIGRDIATIEKTVSFPIVLRDDADAADARIHELMAANGVPPSDFGGYVADTPAAVADVLRKHLDLGFETVIVRMPAPYDYETIQRMPEVADLLVR